MRKFGKRDLQCPKTWKNMEKVKQSISYTQQISKGKTKYHQKWEVGEDLQTLIHSRWKCRLVKTFWRLTSYFNISVSSPTYSISFFFSIPLLTFWYLMLSVCSQYYGTIVKSEVLSTSFTTVPLKSQTVYTTLKNSGYISELISILYTFTP